MKTKIPLGTITFKRNYSDFDKDNYRDVEMTVEVSDDASLGEIHSAMKKFCLAMGYYEQTVDSIFGEDCDWN